MIIAEIMQFVKKPISHLQLLVYYFPPASLKKQNKQLLLEIPLKKETKSHLCSY